MTQQQDPNWLPWIVPMLAVLTVLWAFVKWLFTSAVRTQIAEVANRISVVENTLARIEGRMQERWGDYQEEER